MFVQQDKARMRTIKKYSSKITPSIKQPVRHSGGNEACFVFPVAGDIGAADADMNLSSAAYAWKNWVYYSNGNGALRHLEAPTVTVQMGMIADKHMPIDLTFAGRAYDDLGLFKWANVFENRTRLR
ncbi:uncharacterized protein FTOL_07059 [Fusarium torulosum]|uniref:Uncharacterized protein n=1 Tax=Fusarium torulosum TaxID=33205 RepID=A0AAE8SIM9_9HYPO|nr:uncharacterized protein FTOL_07059 [Fusarium torulosum]